MPRPTPPQTTPLVATATQARRAAFIREYLIDGNATAAAIRAGYSAKTAYSQGARLLKDVEIQRELDRVRQQPLRKLEITREKVTRGLARIAFGKESEDRDRIQALKLLGTDLGMFEKRVAVTVTAEERAQRVAQLLGIAQARATTPPVLPS